MADVTGRLRRWAVPAVPLAWSLLLTLPTTSSTVFWLFPALCAAGAASFAALAWRAFLARLDRAAGSDLERSPQASAEQVFTELQKRPIAPRSRAPARYHVAEIWWSRGRREEARALFREALASGTLDEPWKKRIETRLQQP